MTHVGIRFTITSMERLTTLPLVVPHHVRLARHIVAITEQAIREWAYLRGTRRDDATDQWEQEVLNVCKEVLAASDQTIADLYQKVVRDKNLQPPQFFKDLDCPRQGAP